MITSAIMIEVPSIRPSGKPSLRSPMATDTMAAQSKTILIGSSKFSPIIWQTVLILGGGNEFTPNAFALSARLGPSFVYSSLKPLLRSVARPRASPSSPPNRSTIIRELRTVSGKSSWGFSSPTLARLSRSAMSASSSAENWKPPVAYFSRSGSLL